ncbi:helix-turn-helix domain-containing protein [Paraconexibacter antarcticus]|uniref:Helix-turn-helix domain-containing protein n=1 Tax=Paraconexibacter antarcticus TaxID=2949664 RepID=A0ABY5DNM0_9ACTN|nr:helix-turn-helix domain-containing protein [Paraconexibacter antarcticus]UTI62647.1 helix-turn-helix domain-containing protein [Paraconexibacter antarcticus]
MTPNAPADPVRDGVRTVARAMLPELPAIGEALGDHVLAGEPRFGRDGAADLVRNSCNANSTALLDGLLRNLPAEALGPAEEVVRDTRSFIQRGVTAGTLERGYRLGIAYWCTRWAQAVDEHCPDRAVALAVSSAGTGYLLRWLDHVLERVGEEARDEAERLAGEIVFAQVEEVRRILDGADDVDLAAAGMHLGYSLAGRHLALVVRQAVPGEGPPPDAVAREIAAAVTAARPLVVRVDVATAWCWLAVPEGEDPGVPAPHGAVVGGHGRVAPGLSGFRRSHAEAQEALRVAVLARRPTSTMTAYDDVAVAALCSHDPGWVRDFVLAQLGPLADDGVEAQRFRATLSAFFASGSGYRPTAKALGLHHNTVRHRLARAERMLGRPLTRDRLALEVALHLAAQLGPEVLAGDCALGAT